MKKLTLIFICVLVVATLCAPNVALAETKVANDVHFIAPTGIALVGDYLLISDNVADNQSAILCFDIANGANAHKFTYLLDEQAVSIASSGERLFVIFADSFAEYTIENNTNTLTEVKSYPQADVIDVCVAKLGTEGNLQDTIYFLQKSTSGDSLKYIKDDGTAGAINGMTVNTAYGCLALSNGTDNYVYIAGKNADDTNAIKRWGCIWGWDIDSDELHKNGVNYAENFQLKGITTNNRSFPIVYGSNVMYNFNEDGNKAFVAREDFGGFSSLEHKIIKVASSNSHLVILNSNNQIEIYQLDGTTLGANSGTIGSDQVSTQVPTTYTSFTLAKSSGYPTNIIYKTSDDKTSIDNILTKEQVDQFIILGYEGYENDSYYYVFVNGRFGWVKKSDNATTPDTDSKIEIINTKVSDNVSYNANIKFSSLGMVYVYNLPTSVETKGIREVLEPVHQTASTMTSVKILQQFVEDETNVVWYYVEYNQDSRGFVKSSDVGNFTATLVGPVDAVVDKQINASLFNAVTLHMTNTLDPDMLITDGEKPIKLYSGDLVKVIEVDEEAGAALVQVVGADGTTTFGWVESSRLIATDAITTNAVVGLTALGIAIVLAIVLFSVFISRRRKSR